MKKLVVAIIAAIVVVGGVAASGQKESGAARTPTISFLEQYPLSNQEMELVTKIEQKANVKVKYETEPNSRISDVVAARIASANIPDVVLIEYASAYKQAYNAGMLADFTVHAKSQDLKNVQEMISATTKEFGTLFQEKSGDYYRVPRLVPKAYGWFWVYRKDWADAAGVSYVPTLDGFVALAEAMMKAHPGTVGFTANGGWAPETVFPAAFTGTMPVQWNEPNLARDSSGKWYAVETTNDFRKSVEFLNMLYAKKILDPEIYSMNETLAIQKFVQGKLGILLTNIDYADQLSQALKQSDPNAKVAAFATAPKGPKGYARAGSTGYYMSWAVAKRSDEAVTDGAFRFLDVLHSPEIQKLATRPEGWALTAGGHGVHSWTQDAGVVQWNPVPSLANPLAVAGLKNADGEVVIQDPEYAEYATDLSQQIKPAVATIMDNWFTEFVTGKKDPSSDADWQAYLDAVNKAGLPKLIADITKVYGG